jgi:ElaB/YqjD/DUF883 family membrane-anchored ribosome-binding protein
MSTAKKSIHAADHATELGAPTTERVAGVAHEAIEGAARKAEPVERQLREQAGKAGDQLEAGQAAAAKQLEQSVKSVESFVRERPVAATGIAFAAGALAAILLRR